MKYFINKLNLFIAVILLSLVSNATNLVLIQNSDAGKKTIGFDKITGLNLSNRIGFPSERDLTIVSQHKDNSGKFISYGCILTESLAKKLNSSLIDLYNAIQNAQIVDSVTKSISAVVCESTNVKIDKYEDMNSVYSNINNADMLSIMQQNSDAP